MKKIFKKVIATVAAFAFAAAGLVVAPKTAKAADPTLELYFQLPDGWSADEVGVNVWGNNVSATGTGSTVTCWGDQEKPQAIDAGNGFAKILISNPSGMAGVQFVKGNDAYNGNIWNSAIASLNLTAAYYCTKDAAKSGKWYKEDTFTNEVVKPNVTDSLTMVGTLPGLGWTLPGTALTKSGDTYTITFENVAAGEYKYKILQSAAEYGWNYDYGKGDKVDDNYVLKVNKKSNVTITFTVESTKGGSDFDANLVVGYKFIATMEEIDDGGDNTPAGGDNTPAGGDNTPAGGNNTPAGGDNTPAGGNNTPAGGNTTPAGGNSGNVNAGDSMAVATAIIAVVAACGIVVVSFKKRRQDA
ncbi:MAG TPA: hypothetical protein DCM21_05640 [Butyrivibrio sp.]|nr:hypothetical protein [Butyrivibrio sp.]